MFKRVRRWLLMFCFAVFVLSLLLILPFHWINPPTTAFMLQDNSGRVPVLYEWVAWRNAGVATPIAVVASEDQKFADHFGFDVKSIRDSVEDFSDGGSLRGASTISQQVAKNMYLWSGKSFLRKGIEAYFTVLIELTWSKKRILEVYVNIAEFGPGIYGVGAASKEFLGKSPVELSDAEAALLAAVLPNPKQLRVDNPSAYVRERQNWIIKQMQRLRREQWITLLN
jgi:monofunctional biosynthetic peptidoglycan transglycosylase